MLLAPYIYKIHAMADGSRSSLPAGTSENVLLRWLMPSISDLIFIALLASVLFTSLSVKLLGDAGIGWHIRTGQLILTTHAIPRVDPFSSQIRKPWIAWEWLYDLIVGRLDTTAGLNGVVWLTAVAIATVFAALFRLLVKRGTDISVALVLTLLAMAASMIHFLARPHVLSWLFALICFWIFDSTEPDLRRSQRRIWLFPILMVIWVNVHGGFLLGFVVLDIFWLGAAWSWLRFKESRIEEALQKIAARRRVRDLTLVAVVSALASLVNPYGWHLHMHIYDYLTNRFFMDHIEEFQSPNFHGIAQKCFLAILLIAMAALAANGRKLRASQILMLLFCVYAGLYASRNIPIASVFLVLVVGPIIASFGLAITERMRMVDSRLRGHVWPIAATMATLIIALHGGRAGSARLMDAHFDPQRMPVEAVNFLEKTGLRGPGLSPDYWGGYLIYRLYPRSKVEIDDRHDFYGEFLMRRYLTTMHVEPGWDQLLQLQSCLVLPRKAALTQILSTMPEWSAVHSDDVAIVFVRSRFSQDVDKVPGH